MGNSGSSNDEKGEDEESDCVVESDVSSDEASDEGDGGVGSSDDRSPAAQKPKNRNQTGRTQAVRDFLLDNGLLKRNGQHMENFLHENPNAGEKALKLVPALLMRVFELEDSSKQLETARELLKQSGRAPLLDLLVNAANNHSLDAPRHKCAFDELTVILQNM